MREEWKQDREYRKQVVRELENKWGIKLPGTEFSSIVD